MNFTDLTERAKRTLNAGAAEPRVWVENEIELAACVMQAIGELSDIVMADPNLRNLLQQDYNVTLDFAGEGDLLATAGNITTNTGEALQGGVHIGVVRDFDNNVLVPLAHYSDFLRPQPTVYAYYCLKDRKIATRAINIAVNTPADIQSVNGPLTVTASFAPQEVDDFPAELHDMLVNTLCDVVTRKGTPANANT